MKPAKIILLEYWDSWGWEEDEDDSFSTRNKRENEDKTEAPLERPSLTFHKDFHQHGPTGIIYHIFSLSQISSDCAGLQSSGLGS